MPIPSSAITSAPRPASATSSRRACAERPPSIDVTRPASKRSVTGASTKPSHVYLAAPFELGEQAPCRIREVDAGLRQLAAQELAVDEAEEDSAPSVLHDHLARLEAGRGLVAARRLREEEQEVGVARRLLHRRRRLRERPLARPELEPPLRARVLGRGEELRALLDERLVDEDEHALAGLDPGRADEVPAPAGMLEPLHGGHP